VRVEPRVGEVKNALVAMKSLSNDFRLEKVEKEREKAKIV